MPVEWYTRGFSWVRSAVSTQTESSCSRSTSPHEIEVVRLEVRFGEGHRKGASGGRPVHELYFGAHGAAKGLGDGRGKHRGVSLYVVGEPHVSLRSVVHDQLDLKLMDGGDGIKGIGFGIVYGNGLVNEVAGNSSLPVGIPRGAQTRFRCTCRRGAGP